MIRFDSLKTLTLSFDITMSLIIKGLTKFNDASIWVCKQLEIGLIFLMMVIVLIQVFFRYVLNNSLVWPEETARFMMVWMTFMAAPIAFRMGSNVSLDIVQKMFKGRLYTILSALILLASLATLLLLMDRSIGMVQRGAAIDATSIPIKMTYVYICLPIGLFLTSAVNVEMLINTVISIFKPGSDQKTDSQEPSTT